MYPAIGADKTGGETTTFPIVSDVFKIFPFINIYCVLTRLDAAPSVSASDAATVRSRPLERPTPNVRSKR